MDPLEVRVDELGLVARQRVGGLPVRAEGVRVRERVEGELQLVELAGQLDEGPSEALDQVAVRRGRAVGCHLASRAAKR